MLPPFSLARSVCPGQRPIAGPLGRKKRSRPLAASRFPLVSFLEGSEKAHRPVPVGLEEWQPHGESNPGLMAENHPS